MPEGRPLRRRISSSASPDPESGRVSFSPRLVGQRQTETGLAQKVNGTVAKEGKKTVIGQVAEEAPAGLRPIVIDFTGEFFIPFLQKNTPLIVGMDHKDPAPLFGLPGGSIYPLLPDGLETDIDADMSSHLFDEGDLVGLKCDLAVFFTACSALTAIIEDGI